MQGLKWGKQPAFAASCEAHESQTPAEQYNAKYNKELDFRSTQQEGNHAFL